MQIESLGFLIELIRRNRMLRKKLSKTSHPLFFLIYLAKYITHPTADFQREIFALTESKDSDLTIITSFRGSSKSTICATSLPIWAMVSGQSHFIVLASQTRQQARQHLANIRSELESNQLLKNDLGPFEEEADERGSFALTFKSFDAKIIAVSTEQSIRGSRYKQYRPDLIILDDIEDLNSTRTKEARDKIYDWFSSEIIPLGTPETRIFILGNFLHEFSLVGRLMAEIKDSTRKGVFKRFPLIDEQGVCLWPGRFPDEESIQNFKQKVGDEATWEREYKLNIIAGGDRLIPLDWIKYYDKLPGKHWKYDYYIFTYSAADMAISQSESSDCTAIVSAQVHRPDAASEELQIYVLPNPVNQRLNFPQAIEMLKQITGMYCKDAESKLFIESVGFQEAYYQHMMEQGYSQIAGVKVSADKRTRLALTTKMIQDGTIMFPKTGCEDLIMQLVGFGRERHDDLADAFSMVIQQIMIKHQDGRSLRAWFRFCDKNGGPWI